jgi:hypothetical protein
VAALTASLAVVLALPATAGAVLSGFNGRIVFASGRGEPDDSTAKLYLRTILSGTGGGSAGAAITTAGAVQHRHPTWSPDRTKIAYAAGGAAANFDIFILDLTSPVAIPQNITNSNNVTDDRPAWSPDGTRIAFDSENADASNQLNIKIYNVGTGITTDLTSTTAGTYEHKPAWTPDSQTLFYGTGNLGVAGSLDIVRQPADGSAGAQNVAAAPGISEFQPSISPDGAQMCFTRGDLGSGAARVIKSLANGGGQTELPGTSGVASYNCTWSPDGTKIAYVQGTFASGDLVMENADGPLILITLESTAARFDGNPDWAPDGRPECKDLTVNVNVNSSVTIPLSCADTGPAYEQTPVIVDVPSDARPANGTLGEVQQGNPATVTYTPNANFTGTDSFQARVRDGLAFGTQRGTVTINVTQPPGGGQPGGDTTRPNVSAVTVSPRRWRRGAGMPRFSRARIGTRIRWRLSEDARTTLTFQRALPGRRVGSRCLRPTRARRGRPRCTRFRNAGSLTRANAKAGLNTLRFQGRLTRTRRLGLGRYRLSVGARDAAGNRSVTRRSATFRIVRR